MGTHLLQLDEAVFQGVLRGIVPAVLPVCPGNGPTVSRAGVGNGVYLVDDQARRTEIPLRVVWESSVNERGIGTGRCREPSGQPPAPGTLVATFRPALAQADAKQAVAAVLPGSRNVLPACEAVLIELFYDNQAGGKWIDIGQRAVGREKPTCEPVPLKWSQILDQAADAFQQDRPVGHVFPFFHMDVSLSTRMAYPLPIRPPPAQRDCDCSGHRSLTAGISPRSGVVPGRFHKHAIVKRVCPAYSPKPREAIPGS